jgi:hypothetical protein
MPLDPTIRQTLCVIVLYPVLLVLAGVVVFSRADARGRKGGGWPWFLAWCAAGSLYGFSFLTGLSIGLLIFPFAVVLLFTTAWFAPGPRETIGLVAGVGLVLLLVAAVNWDGESVDPGPWLVGGIFTCAAAVAGYVLTASVPQS